MWDLNFGTWISHRGFTVAFGHGHPVVLVKGWFLVLVPVFGFWLVPCSNFDIDFFSPKFKTDGGNT
jgi:hypothetical protein